MTTLKEAQYSQKITAIQSKFRLVTKRYNQITEELRAKEQTIAKMTQQITTLNAKLSEANDAISQLQKQVSRSGLLQKTYYLRHKANLQSNELIESESASSKHLDSRLKNPKMQVYSEVPYHKLSQQSIAPEDSRVRYKHIRFGSNQEIFNKLKIDINNLSPSAVVKPKMKDRQAEDTSLNRVKSVQLMKIEDGESPKTKTLQKIWQQRDNQICKMDELFQSLTNKLKDYQ